MCGCVRGAFVQLACVVVHVACVRRAFVQLPCGAACGLCGIACGVLRVV